MKLLLIACTVGALSFAPCSANLILNGSFEAPAIANGSWQIGGIANWYSTQGDGGEIQRNAAGTAYDGQQLLELDGNQNSNLLQNVPTTPGASYNLSFQYSPRPGIGAASNPVEVYFGGALLDTLTGDGAGDTVWSLHDFSVFGGSGVSTTLEFRGVGTSDSLGGYIDDVRLNESVRTSVPDAGSSVALFALGLMGMAGLNRKLKI